MIIPCIRFRITDIPSENGTYDLNNRFVKYYRILVREDAADPTSNIIEKILSEKLSSNIDFSIEIEGEGIVFRSDVWYNQLCIAGIAQW